MPSKPAKDSLTILTDMVLPGETNALNHLFGGELLARMDRACCIAAGRHCREIVVTASINHVSFNKPIPVGSVVTIEAKVSRAFSSSMEVYADVFIEALKSGKRTCVSESIYTFVGVDKKGNPVPVPGLLPETDLEIQRYDSALRRRELSLILSGKMKPNKATALKALFE